MEATTQPKRRLLGLQYGKTSRPGMLLKCFAFLVARGAAFWAAQAAIQRSGFERPTRPPTDLR